MFREQHEDLSVNLSGIPPRLSPQDIYILLALLLNEGERGEVALLLSYHKDVWK